MATVTDGQQPQTPTTTERIQKFVGEKIIPGLCQQIKELRSDILAGRVSATIRDRIAIEELFRQVKEQEERWEADRKRREGEMLGEVNLWVMSNWRSRRR